MAAFYSNSVINFLEDAENEIFAALASAHLNNFSELTRKQEISWKKFLKILHDSLTFLVESNLISSSAGILLEYKIPRREKRIDCVLISGSNIIVVEFKFSSTPGNQGKTQLEDYCLDLRDFHKESRNKIIFPLLLSNASITNFDELNIIDELVQRVIHSNKETLANTLKKIFLLNKEKEDILDYKTWENSPYSPTPTIIEAVKNLYNGHGVEEITRSQAEAEDLNKTTNTIIKAIRNAKNNNEKIICFITGVPGAGKTLAGLNIAHLDEFQNKNDSLATFLSGNVPLINVLREALRRDAVKKYKKGEVEGKKNELNRIETFIEKVHTFIDTYYHKKSEVPNTKILIFDEAQRAWSKEHKERKSEGLYDKSEPHILFEIMNRHDDWCAIIALIGGGQEINTGESGLEEWGKSIEKNFKNWKVYISPELIRNKEFAAHKPLFSRAPANVTIISEKDLHLSVAKRSYNAERLSDWVNAVLNLQSKEAWSIYDEHLKDGFPIYLTRNLEQAKTLLKTKRLGTRRVGLVASSGGRRLRAHGIDVDIVLKETHWFLNDSNDVRSSNFLELAGKDFKIQGLELDWACVCWDADFFISQVEWKYQTFGGKSWKPVNKMAQQQFIKNKYRVLMTRAREGMIIWIPEGNEEDSTRASIFYDSTFNFIKSCLT